MIFKEEKILISIHNSQKKNSNFKAELISEIKLAMFQKQTLKEALMLNKG
jgi:hypothetical protein